MRVLAIDPGLKTGWAFSDGSFVKSGVEDFSTRHRESHGVKFLRFRRWLIDILTVHSVELVVFEQPHHRGGAATEVLIGMTTRIQEECSIYNIEYTSINSVTLKKFAAGSKNASKADIIRAAEKRYGKGGLTSDEADALMILAWAREEYTND